MTTLKSKKSRTEAQGISRETWGLLLVLLLSGVALIFLFSPRAQILELKSLTYFQVFGAFRRAILINALWMLFLFSIPPLKRYTRIFLFVQVFFLGYLGSELLFRAFPFKFGPLLPQASPCRAAFDHLDYFFLHRLYSVVPLAALVGFFFWQSGDCLANRLRFGDWQARTDILKYPHPLPWKAVIGRFIFWLGGIFLIFLIFSICRERIFNIQGGALPLLGLAILLYAAFVALFEETIFRGIFLPLFSAYWGEAGGNLLQALLFGLIHFQPQMLPASGIKILLFTFLGWFFGRATRETGGLGASCTMHFLILVILELRKLLA
ncbi:MAG: CPBP family intramembrane glutamic endopeptidase [bacterium]